MLDMDLFFMREAVKEARKAFDEDEVPVGCVIVHKKKIIARAHNQIERLKDPTAHAEMLALTAAANALEMKWLNQSSVYVTIEPCAMCSGALVLARVEKLFYGADDPKTGACGSVFNITDNRRLNHRIKVRKGLLAEECGALVSGFFARKRAKTAAQRN
ncbi:MAG: tRNA adenosine(34) deaminase TadA [Candidatus Omnitrophica bacterium]|jgi:tRNA(adenine34) deaminase|nr:tRNA adenosine(34) deaminase TadA [Candidatus Omnitrophota bacterium]MDD5526361.1 tRNA adenosine(34) deaminase TadA [Candidatus Omnitrophota bacterium]